jgi:hypothetical protein
MSDIDIPALKPLAATTGPLIRPRDHHRSVHSIQICVFLLVLRIRIRRIRMFLGLLNPDPYPLARGIDPGYGSFSHQAKIVRKTLIPTVCDFFFDLSLNNDVNVPSKSNEEKNFFFKLDFCWCLEGQEENSRIRIHSSEAWIRGSGSTPKCHGSATLFLTLESVTNNSAESRGNHFRGRGKVWTVNKSRLGCGVAQ